MKPEQLYTVYMPKDEIEEDDLVIARALSGPDAIKKAVEYDGCWRASIGADEYASFTVYEWRIHATNHPYAKRPETLCATVVKTADAALDKALGMSMLVEQFVRRSGRFWSGRVETDEKFNERLVHVEQRREVRRIDREIATKVIKALFADGYVITCDLMDGEPEFERSTDRDGILAHLFNVDMAELLVEKNGEESWIRLIFSESGWDLLQDYSVDLEYLIDPIVEPYLPWNQPNSDELDHGIRMLVIKSPDDVPKIEDMLKR